MSPLSPLTYTCRSLEFALLLAAARRAKGDSVVIRGSGDYHYAVECQRPTLVVLHGVAVFGGASGLAGVR